MTYPGGRGRTLPAPDTHTAPGGRGALGLSTSGQSDIATLCVANGGLLLETRMFEARFVDACLFFVVGFCMSVLGLLFGILGFLKPGVRATWTIYIYI